MIRLEAFILLGVLIGIALTLGVQYAYRKIHEFRERRMVERAKAEALKVRISEAPTESLLEEISNREDLTESRISWHIPDVEGARPLVTDEDGNVQAATSESIFLKGKK